MESTETNLKQLAKIVRFMAETGTGTNECLEQGCLPLMVHYYSPVPDLKDLERRNVWNKISDLKGLNLNGSFQIKLLSEMAEKFSKECVWPKNATSNPEEFYWSNNCFSFQCASLLHYMIRNYKPSRIIEIGSGLSSMVINNAININKKEESQCIYEIVDPFPSATTKTLSNLSKINITKVEELDKSFFESLDSGDILFIDSGHVVKTGGDVNFLILDVLPILKPGVIIHFHDICMPAEYNKIYFTNPSFRVLWTESYLLQAFLAFNNEFEVLGAVSYLNINYPESFKKIFPNDPGGNSGSFWMRRVSANS